MKPLVIDLFCGLGGWSESFIAAGYEVIGFDIERHKYPKPLNLSGGEAVKRPGMGWSGSDKPDYVAEAFNSTKSLKFSDSEWVQYPGQLVIQDVRLLHGFQFRNAACIVASPPCQRYSYMAMPWDRAKREIRWQNWMKTSPFSPGWNLNDLFDACFRIQREASEAAGHHIPMVVENVKGAQSWVGSARWHYGSFYLWGDVPALMPFSKGGLKVPSANGRRSDVGNGVRFTSRDYGFENGTKCGGDWFNAEQPSISRLTSSRSSARKAASAQIAKIPPPLAEHIARCFYPRVVQSAQNASETPQATLPSLETPR